MGNNGSSFIFENKSRVKLNKKELKEVRELMVFLETFINGKFPKTRYHLREEE